MQQLEVEEATAYLTQLANKSNVGDSFIITRDGTPWAQVTALIEPEEPMKRTWPLYQGIVNVHFPEVWTEEDQIELEKSFYEGDIFPNEVTLRY